MNAAAASTPSTSVLTGNPSSAASAAKGSSQTSGGSTSGGQACVPRSAKTSTQASRTLARSGASSRISSRSARSRKPPSWLRLCRTLNQRWGFVVDRGLSHRRHPSDADDESSELPCRWRLRTRQNWIGGNDYNPCGADFVPPSTRERDAAIGGPLCSHRRRVVAATRAGGTGARTIRDDSPVRRREWSDGASAHSRRSPSTRHRDCLRSSHQRRPGCGSSSLHQWADSIPGGNVGRWIEKFCVAAATSAALATAYLEAVAELMGDWRNMLRRGANPRSDAAAWAVIDVLPAHPVIAAPVAAAVTGRAKAAIHHAIQQLTECGVLIPLSESRRNRSWEAVGILDLLEGLESGAPPQRPSEKL